MRRTVAAILFVICLGPSTGRSAASGSVVSVQMHADGSALLWQGRHAIGRLYPIVYDQDNAGAAFSVGPEGDVFAGLPDGCRVELSFTAKSSGDALHLRYRMTPSQDTRALAARIDLDTVDFGDWGGRSYRSKAANGLVPLTPAASDVIAKITGPALTLGPSPALKGLIFTISNSGLTTVLQDSRRWGGGISVLLSHGEDPARVWNWSRRRPKDFDFVFGFNRPLRRAKNPGPSRPYPYREREVAFYDSAAGVTLSGTLSLPSGPGPFPSAEIIAGSGPTLRDGYGGDNCFLVLADYLTRRGLAVLRYDKRGTGRSTGDFSKAGNLDFAADASAGVDFLRSLPEIDPKRIGLIGHSEGGRVAPMVAARRGDLAFVVILAGPGHRGRDLLLQRWARLGTALPKAEILARRRAGGRILDAELKDWPNHDAFMAEADRIIMEELKPIGASAQATALLFWRDQLGHFTPDQGSRFYLSYDPQDGLRRIRCPVLALAGGLDGEFPPNEELPPIAAALKAGGNKDYEVKILPGLNHSFVSVTDWDPEEALDPSLVETVASWIRHRVE